MRLIEFTSNTKFGTQPARPTRLNSRPHRGHAVEPMFAVDSEDELDERGKAARSLCTGGLPDKDLSKSDLDSCKSQGLRARDATSKFRLTKGGKPVSIQGKKVKGQKYGGPLPDFSKKSSKLSEAANFTLAVPSSRASVEVADLQKVLKAIGMDLGPTGVDGINGTYTTAAIAKFQAAAGIPADGKPNADTIATLNKIMEVKPELFAKLTHSSSNDVKFGGSVADIDITTIQDPDFNTKLNKVADQLGVDTNSLIAIMKQESGVDPTAINKSSGASGLIQFMPKTALALGTTVEQIRKMSAVEQLDYVYRYFKMNKVKPGMDVGDLYLAVFYPAAVGKEDTHVISTVGHPIYNQNKGLDRNKDGTLTVADVKTSVARFV